MPTLRPRKTYEELIAGHYGVSAPRKAPRLPGRAVSMSSDDGEVLAQPPAPPAPPAPSTNGTAAAADEYVVLSPAEPVIGSPVDEVLPPVAAAAPPPPPPAPATPEPSAPPAQLPAPEPTATAASVEEDELARDMQAILSGQMVFDPASGRTMPRDEAPAPAPAREAAPPPPATNEQAIFDRIAESMTYANAYDLGTHELENRFSDFDRLDDIDKRPRPAPAEPPKVGSKDFLEDLDKLHEPSEEVPVEEVPVEEDRGPIALSLGPAFAEPMYDAGEHAQASDLYAGQLHIGASPHIAVSYGEIVALAGDLYETVDDMMRADLDEVARLKDLVDRNTRFYVGGKRDKSLDVSNDRWDKETNKRYLKLAERNYTHFAPDTLFNDAAARAAVTHGNHKTAWEEHHRRAIEEAQRLALLPENQNRSYVPESALIINAFGDHFLTDAFASGHLINKDVMIAKFKAKFFHGSSLTSAAEDFFERVAEKAFVGEVRKQFSVLETFEPVFLWWNPNIDTTNAFRKLLVKAAKQETVRVANLVVKALHDRLNGEETDVTNAAGDAWPLTGDGFLNPKTLPIMRKAVEQSIANINDPSILQSNLNFRPYFERVWRHTPQLTPSSKTKVMRLVEEYTDPTSTVLSDAAAEIIRLQLTSMINTLIAEHKLKPA